MAPVDFPKSLNLPGGLGTALKPAHEPIVVARKPLVGTVAQNVSEFGTGALNIDSTRIGMREERFLRRGVTTGAGMGYHGAEPQDVMEGGAGRWPANVALSHLPECEPVGTRRVKSGNHGEAPGGFGEQHVGGGKRTDEDFDASGGYGLETVTAWECAPGCSVAELDRQSGETISTGGRKLDGSPFGGGGSVAGDPGFGDTGGASRFRTHSR